MHPHHHTAPPAPRLRPPHALTQPAPEATRLFGAGGRVDPASDPRRGVYVPVGSDPEAIDTAIERLIDLRDRQDAPGADLEPDYDGEEESDACPAADDDLSSTPWFARRDYLPGDADDAELNGDEHEPDDDDRCGANDDMVTGRQPYFVPTDYQLGMHAGPGPFQKGAAWATVPEIGVYRAEVEPVDGGSKRHSSVLAHFAAPERQPSVLTQGAAA